MTVCCPRSRFAVAMGRGAALALGAIAGLSCCLLLGPRAAIALPEAPQGGGTVADPSLKQVNRDRVEQCNQLVEVLNRRTGLDSSLTPGQQPTARELSDLATRATGLAGTIGTVPLDDRALLQYRNNFAALYRDLGSAMAVLANAIGRLESIPRTPEGRAEAERILEQVAQAERTFDEIPGREAQLVDGLNGYCVGR
jgi:hypothetical protein